MEELVSAVGSLASGIAAIVGIYVAYKVHANQKLLAQRQLLLPLWEHMAALRRVNPAAPIEPEVVNNVNTLELVALCCEGGMIDEKVILRTFRDQFIMHYEDIESCPNMPGLGKDGKKLLYENKAAVSFYRKLNDARLLQDRIIPA